MNTFSKLILLGAFGGLVISATGCSKLQARDQLNRGVTAYKGAQFNSAIEHFQQAIQLDPTLVNAKIYLATAYQAQFIPGSPSPDNLQLGQQALDEYKVILDQDPNNANAIAGIARLNFDMGNLDEAQQYYTRSLSVSPNDPEAYYTLGDIAYQKVNKGITSARQSLGITDLNAPMVAARGASAKAKSACQALKAQDESIIDDGITQLNKALELRPNYADAMAYLNLLYRDKASLTCGDQTQYEALVKTANDFNDRSVAINKAAAAAQNKAESGGVVLNNSGSSSDSSSSGSSSGGGSQ